MGQFFLNVDGKLRNKNIKIAYATNNISIIKNMFSKKILFSDQSTVVQISS